MNSIRGRGINPVCLWLWSRDLIQIADFQARQHFKDCSWLVEVVIHWMLVSIARQRDLFEPSPYVPIFTRYQVSMMFWMTMRLGLSES